MTRAKWHLLLIPVFVHLLFTGYTFNLLPRRIPVHFDLYGAANRFAPRTILIWATPLILAISLMILIYLSGRAVRWAGRREPHALSIPHRYNFLKMKGEERETYLLKLENHMVLQSLLIWSFFFLIHISLFVSVQDRPVKNPFFLPLFALWITLSIYGFIRFYVIRKREFDDDGQ